MASEADRNAQHETGDVVLQEVWRAKDALSEKHGHDVKKMLAEARERQKHSGHPVVNFEDDAERRQQGSAPRFER